MPSFSTLILAGGKSSRMGTDKALLPYRGKPLICYATALAEALNSEVILSANSAYLDHLGYRVVGDTLPVSAPLAGIHAGLAASTTGWNLVLSCDMPHIPVELIRQMARYLDDAVLLVLPRHGDFTEPLCGFWHRELIPVIEANAELGKFKLLEVLRNVPHRIVRLDDVPEKDLQRWFLNVNRAADLDGTRTER